MNEACNTNQIQRESIVSILSRSCRAMGGRHLLKRNFHWQGFQSPLEAGKYTLDSRTCYISQKSTSSSRGLINKTKQDSVWVSYSSKALNRAKPNRHHFERHPSWCPRLRFRRGINNPLDNIILHQASQHLSYSPYNRLLILTYFFVGSG